MLSREINCCLFGGNIPMDKNPQDRISIQLQRRIIGFSNIIRLVLFLKRDTHSLKWLILLLSLYILLLLCVKHICAWITYGIDIKSSNSKLLKTHFGRLSSAGGKPGQYSVKPPQPGRWSQTTLILIFFTARYFLACHKRNSNPCGRGL